MFLRTIPEINNLNISNISEGCLLKRFSLFINDEDKKAAIELLSKEQITSLYNTFISILKGNFCPNILHLKITYTDTMSTRYMPLDDNTKQVINDVIDLIYYIDNKCQKEEVIFSEIKDELKSSGDNSDFYFLSQSGYSLFEPKDLRILTNYFWSYKLPCRIES